jgi:hypothetical protein
MLIGSLQNFLNRQVRYVRQVNLSFVFEFNFSVLGVLGDLAVKSNIFWLTG